MGRDKLFDIEGKVRSRQECWNCQKQVRAVDLTFPPDFDLRGCCGGCGRVERSG